MVIGSTLMPTAWPPVPNPAPITRCATDGFIPWNPNHELGDLYQRFLDKDATLAVIGLGYVGLPIALAFARHIRVIGFDIHAGSVEQMKRGIDPSEELEADAFEGCDITFTADPADLKAAQFFVVAVPTPINATNQPGSHRSSRHPAQSGTPCPPAITSSTSPPSIRVVQKRTACLSSRSGAG